MKFQSLLDFVAELHRVEHDLKHTPQQLVEVAADVVQTSAKGFLGTHALDWTPLAASTLETKGADTPLLETGEMRDSIEKTVGHHEADVGSNLDRALFHEFGTAKIPPRPFFAPAADEARGALALMAQHRVDNAFRRGRHGGKHSELMEALHLAKHAIREVADLIKETVE